VARSLFTDCGQRMFVLYKRSMADGGSGRMPAYLIAMVRRAPPDSAGVVPGSTPVVAFGDPARARVATLGINPSRNEFLDGDGHLLDGSRRRLATLVSLSAGRLNDLTDAQAAAVVAECAAYFQRNPYRLWFDPLDQLMQAGVGASFHDGTACRLDLVQWASDPVWGRMSDERVRQALIDDGVPHLRAQLDAHSQIEVVLCNGRQVIEQVRAAGLADLRDAGVIRNGAVTCRLYEATAARGRARWLASSTNLQSSWGVSTELKRDLAAWLAQAHRHAGPPGPPHGTTSPPTGAYLPRRMRISGKRELAEVLAGWLERSDAATIGDVGSFGRTACLRIQVGGTEVILNADTKRAAAEEFVRASAADPDRLWLVVASRRGNATKVLPNPDAIPAPGWYAYLTRPGTPGQLI
jgi:hypothetical protein